MRIRSSWSSLAIPSALFALIAMTPLHAAHALKAPPQLGELEDEDRKALETIAGHDAKLRDAVLKASLHPDALVETQRIQEQSSASFRDRISKLDKKQQEQMWEIVREPGLLAELATENRPSRSELDAIAARYPESLASAIRTFGSDHHDLVVDIAEVHQHARDRFDVAVADLDADTQQAFRDLVDQPELMSVLVRRVNLVVRLGDSYRKNPNDTRSYLTAIAQDVEKRKAADQEEWKKRIENDPEAAEELDEAARDYADENGYDYDELTSSSVQSRVNVVVNPYPYWFGYPVWYADAYLYPYGYWYPYPVYFGYYHYHDHFAWYGLPSLGFMHWFYYGHHHHHYSHLSNCFSGHYNGRRYAPTHYNATVNNFIARSGRTGTGRGDGSTGRGGDGSFGRGDGSRATTTARNVSYSGRDRGFFFNRHRAVDQSTRVAGRRGAPGERGAVIDRSRANAETREARQTPSSQQDRGAARGRSGQQRSREQEPRFFDRSKPESSREAAPAQTRSGGRQEREWAHAPKEWPHAPRVIREEPRTDPSTPRASERSGVERGSRQSGGGDAPAVHRSGGGQSGRDSSSYRGGSGQQGRVYSGGDRGGSRSRSGSSGGNSGGVSRGGSRGGDFGGGSWGGGGGFNGGGGMRGGGGGRGR